MRQLDSRGPIKRLRHDHFLSKCLTLLGHFPLIVIFFTFPVWANNYHDHFQSLPLAENFRGEAQALFSLDKDAQKLSVLFPQQTTFEILLAATFHLAPSWIRVFVESGGMNGTLLELCEKLGGDPTQNLIKLLSLEDQIAVDEYSAQSMYLTIERLRGDLLMKANAQTVEKIFTDYFKIEPLENRSEIELTVPKWLFSPAQVEKLIKIKSIALDHGSHIKYFYSFTRATLSRFKPKIFDTLKELINRGIVDGIDITGSIKENSSDDYVYEEALQKLFNFASQENVPLKIHSFEAADSGSFYEALRKTISGFEFPLEIEIGHINKLSQSWIDILKSNIHVHVSINANIASAEYLHHDTSIKSLADKIDTASRSGLAVKLGSDGRGILKNSSYVEQKERLKSHCLVEMAF